MPKKEMSKKSEKEIREKNFVLFVVAAILIVCIGFGVFISGYFNDGDNGSNKTNNNEIIFKD